MIEIKDLYYTYPDGRKALKGISLSIGTNERVGIVGPNGSGKSTLLAQLPGLLRGAGQIKIAGLELKKENLGAIRKIIGLVFQNPDDQLFCPTVYDDVAFGPINLRLKKEEVATRVDKALGLVGLDGYGGRSPFHLSFGEKKRVSLATVLAQDPGILLLDEPSSNLDPRQRKNLIEWVTGYDRTLLIATHDLDIVQKVCKRCVVLNNGRIIADGSVNDILKDRSFLEQNRLL
jgi:cobalt/nickel transport system ATP-binding protein